MKRFSLDLDNKFLVAFSLFLIWVFLILFLNHFPDRLNVNLQKKLTEGMFKKFYNSTELTRGEFPGKFNQFTYNDVEFYTNFKTNNYVSLATDKRFQKNQKILFIGDSFMMQYFARVEDFYKKKKSNSISIFAIKGACFFGIDKNKENDKRIKKNRKQCIKMINTAVNFAIKEKVSKVVIGNSFENYFDKDKIKTFSAGLNQKESLNEIARILKIFQKNNIKTYLILAPVGNFYILNDLKRTFSLKDGINIKLESKNLIKKDLNSQVKKDIKQFQKFVYKIYDPLDFICNTNGVCKKLDRDGYPIFKDNTHISDKFAKENMNFIDEILSN